MQNLDEITARPEGIDGTPRKRIEKRAFTNCFDALKNRDGELPDHARAFVRSMAKLISAIAGCAILLRRSSFQDAG